jgi:hypothetical protein
MKSFLDELPQLAVIKNLEKDLGIPPEFFDGLLEEDDWSFVIKMHSLIEAAINHLLVEALGKPELRDIISRLALNNERTGGMAFLKKMKLLDTDSLNYVRVLSEIRNRFVHEIVSVNLEQFFSHLHESSRQRLHKGFKWGYEDEAQAEVRKGDLYDMHELLKVTAIILIEYSQYKLAIWIGSIIVLRQIHEKVARGQYEKRLREIDDQLIALLSKMGREPGEES